MEIYDNERDQTEALKRFLIDYGKLIISVIILVIAALIGWHYWNNHSTGSKREQSLSYTKIIEDLKTGSEAAVAATEKFSLDNKNSYGALASLALAQHFVVQKQLPQAEKQLQQALADNKDIELQALISLRLARVQIAQKKPDVALKTLESIKGSTWVPLIADLRGDALYDKGDKQAAREAWRQGINDNTPESLRNLLQMKIDTIPA